MCSLRGVISCGIILAIIDILHGMVTASFYCYQLVMDTFYVCPIAMDVVLCSNKMYFYWQMFATRVYIGIGEGIVGVLFAIFYIIALIKHKPSLTWIWLLKAFGVIGINVYFLAIWLIRRGRFLHINQEQLEDENLFIYTAEGLTAIQVVTMILFCLIGGIFTYKVCEERVASRRNLRRRKSYSPDASAPPMDYDSEEGQYLNDALTESEKTLPGRSSKQSLTDISRADTFKHSTGV
ncbi:hypothetical protein Pmani_016974 [Petrolisthes manimaculis]|uniref:Uncharacterized protein n=1 Tax=Petrolisthes manimaculis TaxID=1843537 RepID=A0AAE1PN48_9EUCA|nr:hypothetical protein Pmani_016974 [Petrolisthes manimaculis]